MKRFGPMMRHAAGLLVLAALLLPPAGLPAADGLTDRDVADRVEDELALDPAVPSHRIEVAVNDGIVTLGGSVRDALARERAARLAETVKGVRGVVSAIEVTPSPGRTDSAIEMDVRRALLDDRATESYEVDVAVENNVVTLTGEVDSWQERALAGKVALGVRGVQDVENNIEVFAEGPRPDQEIKADIEKALRWNALVDDGLIQVRVDDGRVTLVGTVGSAAEKTRAVTSAYTAGVTSVSAEELDVRMWAREPELRGDKYDEKSDAEIRGAVEDALAEAPRVAASAVDPQVDDREVTLRGTVDSLKAKRAAEKVARNTVGVSSVENRLRVRPENVAEDAAVERRVTDALQRDPYVNSREISITVSNGVASLYGTVATYYEKAHAEDLASRQGGVVAVENYLAVADEAKPYASNPYLDEEWNILDYDWYGRQGRQTTRSDAAIAQEIERELYWSPFVEGEAVEVEVEDGVATLSGRVDSWSEYNAANASAWESGAVDVRNNLILD